MHVLGLRQYEIVCMQCTFCIISSPNDTIFPPTHTESFTDLMENIDTKTINDLDILVFSFYHFTVLVFVIIVLGFHADHFLL